MTNLTHNSLFRICLFQISTCFEHSCAHHQENQLYQYDIWYAGLGGTQIRIPHGHLHRVTYTRCRIDTINSPDDEVWLEPNPAYQTVTYIE